MFWSTLFYLTAGWGLRAKSLKAWIKISNQFWTGFGRALVSKLIHWCQLETGGLVWGSNLKLAKNNWIWIINMGVLTMKWHDMKMIKRLKCFAKLNKIYNFDSTFWLNKFYCFNVYIEVYSLYDLYTNSLSWSLRITPRPPSHNIYSIYSLHYKFSHIM